MPFAYITADKIGAQTGGGVVTLNERGALESLGEVQSPLPDWLTEQGGDVWRPDRRALTWSYGLDLRLAHFYAGTFSDTVSALKARKAKVAYTAAAHDVSASRAEHERLGVPFDYPHLNDPALWRRYVSGYLAADLLICPSTHSKGVMVGFGADPKKITVIPHGVDLPEGPIKPMPAQFTVGYLGAVGPDKGMAYLLQAWKKLAYTDALLVIAGRDTTSPFMRQVVDHFGGGMVHLRGWVRDVADFYGDVSLYVQPSVTEGFGCEVLEAMAHGRAAVASTGCGASDLLPKGWTFPPRDVDALAALIDHFKGCKNLDKTGEVEKVAASAYSWTKIRKRYVEAWEGLLGA